MRRTGESANGCWFRCDSIEKLRSQLPTLKAELQDEAKFREIYNYAFNFSREVCPLATPALSMTRMCLFPF